MTRDPRLTVGKTAFAVALGLVVLLASASARAQVVTSLEPSGAATPVVFNPFDVSADFTINPFAKSFTSSLTTPFASTTPSTETSAATVLGGGGASLAPPPYRPPVRSPFRPPPRPPFFPL